MKDDQEMDEREVFLDKIHIKNFLSLRDVELPLKPLTILVGPNASGKSNILEVLQFLRSMIVLDKLPSMTDVKGYLWSVGEDDVNLKSYLWAGGADTIRIEVDFYIGKKKTIYKVEIQPQLEFPIAKEELLVDNVKVIGVKNGEGEVRDEDNKNSVPFHSEKLALKSAGNYGNKPITQALANYIRGWRFYDFNLVIMRDRDIDYRGSANILGHIGEQGQDLQDLLVDWHREYPEGFEAVNRSLEDYTGFTIEAIPITDRIGKIQLREGYKNPIPLIRASDGTLRLLAYHILLNEPDIAPLIIIEEPEQNLHPAVLYKLGNLLEQLAERTQVIITTHSSQFLDTFSVENLTHKLGILLLRNRPSSGTEVINLAEVQEDREALKSWIEDFGIGSAIFHSELIQDVVED